MVEGLLALTKTNIEGFLVVVASLVLFGGSTYMLTAAVMGRSLGYLVVATSFFAFLVILSMIWAFGAPGTKPFLGPHGDLPTWIPLAAGQSIESSTYPVVEQYPSGPWKPADEANLTSEEEPASLAIQEFLAEEAGTELRRAGIEGELSPEDFTVEDVEFTEVDGTPLVAATAFATSGGLQVQVFGYKDPGNEALPSYLFLAGSIIGFILHLPFLDRAEKERKAILTGGGQAPWRGPA